MPFRTIRFLILIIFLMPLVAACGGDEASSPAPADPPTAAAVETEVAPTTAPPSEIPTETPPSEPTAAEVVIESPVSEPEENAAPEAAMRTFQIIPEQSQASYEVQEEFFNRPVDLFTAVGTTNVFEGQFTLNINNGQIELGDNTFIVDLSTLTSDDGRRDSRIRGSWLESSRYPFAEFSATSIEDFPADAAEGQEIPFKVNGNMTIREITQPLTFDTVARLDGDTFTGTATSHLFMKDYGFDPPSILGMLEVTDGVTVTVDFVAQEISP